MRNATMAVLVCWRPAPPPSQVGARRGIRLSLLVQGRGVGIPGDCSYQTYGQCMASASGRGVYCNVNPRAALSQQQQRRGRNYRDY